MESERPDILFVVWPRASYFFSLSLTFFLLLNEDKNPYLIVVRIGEIMYMKSLVKSQEPVYSSSCCYNEIR